MIAGRKRHCLIDHADGLFDVTPIHNPQTCRKPIGHPQNAKCGGCLYEWLVEMILWTVDNHVDILTEPETEATNEGG